MLRWGSWFGPFPLGDHTGVRADRLTPSLWYKFRVAKKTFARGLPELAPDFPSAAMPVYEKEIREADASCVLSVQIYSAHWPFTGPHKTAWIDRPGCSQVFVKQIKWVGWKTPTDNLKSAG